MHSRREEYKRRLRSGNDPGVRWGAFDAVIIRSTWDYHLEVERFAQWVAEVSAQTTLINDARTVQWNLHKNYLLELQAKGVTIVPTTLLARGEYRAFGRVLQELGASEVVVKPAVSASGRRTVAIGGEYAALADGERILRESVADNDTLVQPFLREIFDHGERPLMFFAGRFSHAVVRPPLSAGAAPGKSPGQLLDPPPEQTKFAHVDAVRACVSSIGPRGFTAELVALRRGAECFETRSAA